MYYSNSASLRLHASNEASASTPQEYSVTYFLCYFLGAFAPFEYDFITVSYAWELISLSKCYSQGDGFNTSLSRLCTVPTSHLSCTYLTCSCFGVRSVLVCVLCWV